MEGTVLPKCPKTQPDTDLKINFVEPLKYYNCIKQSIVRMSKHFTVLLIMFERLT